MPVEEVEGPGIAAEPVEVLTLRPPTRPAGAGPVATAAVEVVEVAAVADAVEEVGAAVASAGAVVVAVSDAVEEAAPPEDDPEDDPPGGGGGGGPVEVDPLAPEHGGWFTGARPDPCRTEPLARAVAGKLSELREAAAAMGPGVSMVEDPLRGVARAVALALALEGAEDTGGRRSLLGKVQTPEVLDDLAAARLDRSCAPLLDMALQRARAAGRGAAGPVDKLTRQVDDHAKRRRTQLAVEGAGEREAAQPQLPAAVAELRVPPEWSVSPQGIRNVADLDRIVAVTDRWVVIVGRSWAPETGEHFVDLMWPTLGGEGTTTKTVPRADIATPAALRALAAYGAPLCQDPRWLVGFLGALEAANEGKIPTRVSVRTMGWASLPGGVRVFVLGSEVLGTGGEEVEVLPMEGAESAMAGWGRGGSLRGWADAVAEPLQRFPALGVFYLAALAAPLLEVLDRPSFFVDLAGDTSTGKSTALEVAASVWGSPDARRGVFKSWDATAVGLERTAETLGCLPVLLDDTKVADRNVARNLYRLASGQGKIRGRPDGLRKQGSWRTLVISTGEAPVTERSEDGGTRARVLSLTDPPFPGLPAAEGRAVVQGLSSAAHAHHGHAGRAMVQHLTGADWGALRARYGALREGFAGDWASSGVAVRLAAHAAVLLLAAELAGDLGLPVPDVVEVETLLRRVAESGAVESDRPRVALVSLLSWVGSNPGRVFPGHDSDRDPHAGWIARRLDGGDLAIVGDAARRYLEDMGHDVSSATRAWGQRGWLEHDGGKLTRALGFGGYRIRCYRVRAAAVEGVMGDAGGES